MDKRAFFDKLHNELAEKYNTSTDAIMIIRHLVLGKKMDAGEVRNYIVNYLRTLRYRLAQEPKEVESPRLIRWQNALKLISRNDNLDELLQKTQFDK